MKNRVVKLSQLGKIITGKTPSKNFEEPFGNYLHFFTPSDIDDQRYLIHTGRNLSKQSAEKLKNNIIPEKSILVSCIGSDMGKVCISKFKGVSNQQINSIIPNENTDYLYLYYLLKSKKKLLKRLGEGGSTMPILNKTDFSNIEVTIPNLDEQKKISKFFGSLDDKIELNQKMNETLEDIGKTLFKSWFIDFDPVREKAEGRSTNLSKEISDLFPDIFEESELGKIPKNYTLDKLGDHIKITKGQSYKSIELQNSDTALVTLKSFQRNGGYREDGLKEYVGTFKEEQVVKEGDLIVAFTDVTQSADVIGKPAIVIDNPKYSKLVISLDVGVIRTEKSSSLSKNFIYFLMLSKRYASNSLAFTNGTNVLHLDKKAITDFVFCLPPNKLLEKFNQISSEILKKISTNTHENKILKDLRNVILPKFISGELKIPNDEKKVMRTDI